MKVCLQTTTRVVVVGGCGLELPTFNHSYFINLFSHFHTTTLVVKRVDSTSMIIPTIGA